MLQICNLKYLIDTFNFVQSKQITFLDSILSLASLSVWLAFSEHQKKIKILHKIKLITASNVESKKIFTSSNLIAHLNNLYFLQSKL